MQYQSGQLMHPAFAAAPPQQVMWGAGQEPVGPQSANFMPAILAQFVVALDERSRADVAAREAERATREAERRRQQDAQDQIVAGLVQQIGALQESLGNSRGAVGRSAVNASSSRDSASSYWGGAGHSAVESMSFPPFDDGARGSTGSPTTVRDEYDPAPSVSSVRGDVYDVPRPRHHWGDVATVTAPRQLATAALPAPPRAPRASPGHDVLSARASAAASASLMATTFVSRYAPRGRLELVPVVDPLDPAGDPSQRAAAAKTVRDLGPLPQLHSTGPPHVRLFLAEVVQLQRRRPDELHQLEQFLLASCSSFFPPEGEASLTGADSRLAHVLSDGAEQSFFRGFRFGQLLELLHGYGMQNAPLLSQCVRYLDPVRHKQPHSIFTQSVLQQMRNVVHILAASCASASGAGFSSFGSVSVGPDDDLRASAFLRENCLPREVVEFVSAHLGSVNLNQMPALDIEGPSPALGLLSFVTALCLPPVGLVSVRQGARGQQDVDCAGARMAALDPHRSAFGSDGQHDPTLARPMYPLTPLVAWRRMCDTPLAPGALGPWMLAAPSTRAAAPAPQPSPAPGPRGAAAEARASAPPAPAAAQRAPPQFPVAADSRGDAGRGAERGSGRRAPFLHPPTPLRTRADAMGLDACRQHIIQGQCRCPDSSSKLHVDQLAIDSIQQIAAAVGRPSLNGLCIPYVLAGSGDGPGSPACACRGGPPAGNCSSTSFAAHPPIPGRQSTVFNEFVTRALSAAGARHALPASAGASPGRSAGAGGHGGPSRWGTGGPGHHVGAPPVGGTPLPSAAAAGHQGHAAEPPPSTPPPSAFMITRGRVHASSDPSLPMRVRLGRGSSGLPECTAEVGPFAARVLCDTGADASGEAWHFVSPAFLSRLVASGAVSLATLGFSVRTLDPPVTRLTANGLASYTRAAVIPVRVYLSIEQEEGDCVPRDLGNETDSYLVLPELPDNLEYPHDLVLSSASASAASPDGRRRWTTTLRMLIESGTADQYHRVFPPLAAGPSSMLQLVRNLGAMIDPTTGQASRGLLADDGFDDEDDSADCSDMPPLIPVAASAAPVAPSYQAAPGRAPAGGAPPQRRPHNDDDDSDDDTLPPLMPVSASAASVASPSTWRVSSTSEPAAGAAAAPPRHEHPGNVDDGDSDDDSDDDTLPPLMPVSASAAFVASPSTSRAAFRLPSPKRVSSTSEPAAGAAAAPPRHERPGSVDDVDTLPPLIHVRSGTRVGSQAASAAATRATPSAPASVPRAAVRSPASPACEPAVEAAATPRASGDADDDDMPPLIRVRSGTSVGSQAASAAATRATPSQARTAPSDAESAAAATQIVRICESLCKSLRAALGVVELGASSASPAVIPRAALHASARLAGPIGALASQVGSLPPEPVASQVVTALREAATLAAQCVEHVDADSPDAGAQEHDLRMLAKTLRASASALASAPICVPGTPVAAATAPAAPRRGRALPRHVGFRDAPTPSDDEPARRRPVSAPAPSRPVSFAAMASATTSLDDGDLCMAGFPVDAVPREPTAASAVSDADIDARFDWDAITDGG